MRKSIISITTLIVILLLSSGLYAADASLLSITEEDRDGGKTQITGRLHAVDINSVLKIDVNTDEIKKRVAETINGNQRIQEISAQLEVLNKVLEKAPSSLSKFTEETKKIANGNQDDYAKYISALNSISNEFKPLFTDIILKNTQLRNSFNTLVSKGITKRSDTYKIILDLATDEFKRLNAEYDKALKEAGVSIQMAAWINSNESLHSVHLPGFDWYKESTPMIIERFSMPSPADLKAQLNVAEDISNQFRTSTKDGFDAVFQLYTSFFKNELSDSIKCISDLSNKANDIKQQAHNLSEDLQKMLETMHTVLSEISSPLEEITNKYIGDRWETSATDLLTASYTDIISIRNELKRAQDNIGSLIILIPSEINKTSGAVKKSLQEFYSEAKECHSMIENKCLKAVNSILAATGIVQSAETVSEEAYKFTEKVIKHDVLSIPSSTSLNLITAGTRKPGDFIAIRMAMLRTDSSHQMLEEIRLSMFRVLSHIDVNVGLIFAQPTDKESTDLHDNFQAAPAYSVLLKSFGLFKKETRRSMLYQRLYDPGIGLNVSALDFNHDDTPEIGLALVGSLFKDYIQAGFGYNINENEYYWFFGLRLPLAQWSLPVGNYNSSE